MTTYRFTVWGEPRTKNARKAFILPGKDGKPMARIGEPKENREREAQFAAIANAHAPTPILTGPLAVSLRFVFRVPDGWPQWKREAALAGAIEHDQRPDRENLMKLVHDAMTGSWWPDDAQICAGEVTKAWGERACTEVTVSELPTVRTAAEWKVKRRRRVT